MMEDVMNAAYERSLSIEPEPAPKTVRVYPLKPNEWDVQVYNNGHWAFESSHRTQYAAYKAAQKLAQKLHQEKLAAEAIQKFRADNPPYIVGPEE